MVEYSIEEIAASVAHEVKNPLSVIIANLQLIELDDNKKHEKSYFVLYRELHKIDRLMNGFLDLTKPTALVLSVFNYSNVIDDVVATFEAVFANKNILFAYKNSAKVKICGDYNKLSQVLINLVSNAIDALEENSNKELTIEVYTENNFVTTKVIDNGKGIPAEYLEKIGRPFFTTKSNGNGLGLSTSKLIVEKHKGAFNIESTIGSIFSFSIPILKETT